MYLTVQRTEVGISYGEFAHIDGKSFEERVQGFEDLEHNTTPLGLGDFQLLWQSLNIDSDHRRDILSHVDIITDLTDYDEVERQIQTLLEGDLFRGWGNVWGYTDTEVKIGESKPPRAPVLVAARTEEVLCIILARDPNLWFDEGPLLVKALFDQLRVRHIQQLGFLTKLPDSNLENYESRPMRTIYEPEKEGRAVVDGYPSYGEALGIGYFVDGVLKSWCPVVGDNFQYRRVQLPKNHFLSDNPLPLTWEESQTAPYLGSDLGIRRRSEAS